MKLTLTSAYFNLKYTSKFIDSRVAGICTINALRDNITVGNDFFSGCDLYISLNKHSNLRIGNYVMFAPQVMVLGGNHNYSFNKGHLKKHQLDDPNSKDIVVESGCWISARVTLLSVAYVDEGSVVGASCVVNGYLPPYCICVGSPARPIKSRYENIEELKEVLESGDSNYSLHQVLVIYNQYGINLHE